MIDRKFLIHRASGGGKVGGPRGLALWHLAGGKSEFHKRLVQPALHITDKVLLWCYLGFNGMIIEGFDKSIIEFAVMSACMGSSDHQVVALASELPEYLEELRDLDLTVFQYGGCPLYDPAVLKWRSMERKNTAVKNMAELERSIYIPTRPCFDKCGRADATWMGTFKYISQGQEYSVEGRLPVDSPLNIPSVGKLWERDQRVMHDESLYIPIEQLVGFRGEFIRPSDGDMNIHAQWCTDRGIHAICDVTELDPAQIAG